MTRRTKVAVLCASIGLAVAIVAVVIFGLVGVKTSASVGTQKTICGTTVGVSLVDEDHVSFLGNASDGPLAVGDKVRLSPVCVVQILGIERTNHDREAVGGVARVDMRWGPW